MNRFQAPHLETHSTKVTMIMGKKIIYRRNLLAIFLLPILLIGCGTVPNQVLGQTPPALIMDDQSQALNQPSDSMSEIMDVGW